MLLYTLAAVAAINAITFVVFGLDKWKAGRERRRISEATLIGLAWAGGFLGGWLAMQLLRHKTQKTSFKVKMWLATLLNLAWPVGYLVLR